MAGISTTQPQTQGSSEQVGCLIIAKPQEGLPETGAGVGRQGLDFRAGRGLKNLLCPVALVTGNVRKSALKEVGEAEGIFQVAYYSRLPHLLSCVCLGFPVYILWQGQADF